MSEPKYERLEMTRKLGYAVDTNGVVFTRWLSPHKLGTVWRPLALKRTRGGYLYANLTLGEPGARYERQLHVGVLVLETFVGPRPEGKQCCHWDGNPANNKLSNLRWGTPQENADDRKRHGHNLAGQSHGSATVTEADVIALRVRCANGEQTGTLSQEFGLSKSTICRIASGKLWVDTAGPRTDLSARSRGERGGISKLTEHLVVKILCRLQDEPRAVTKIGKEFGVSAPTICDIRDGRTWLHIPRPK